MSCSVPDGQAPVITVRPDVRAQWENVSALASARGVACMLVLTKCDLLHSTRLPQGLSPYGAAQMLRAEYFACLEQNCSPTAKGTNGGIPRSATSTKTHSAAVNVLDDTSDHSLGVATAMLMKEAFPDIDNDEEPVGLGEGVFLCLSTFCTSDRTVLSKRGSSLPIAKWKDGVLALKDHVWLHELAQPLPNPQSPSTTQRQAERLGKGSTDPTRESFWVALMSIAEQLGSFEPVSLGAVHSSTLLTTGGSLLICLRSTYETEPNLGDRRRNLSWRPVDRVASRLDKVAQASEYVMSDETLDGSAISYALDVKKMLASAPSNVLKPCEWLEKLQSACASDETTPLTPGTYMIAFYTQSTKKGLRVLLPQKGLTCLPPVVKISDGTVSAGEWKQLCEMEDAVSGKSDRNIDVPANWADAKGWMGPEVGSEGRFTFLQKFFYGVLSLRRQLELKCSAISEDLRYSSIEGAAESLRAVGVLFKDEIILADPAGKVQLVVLYRHLTLGEAETFPSRMQWTPFPIFEARCFQRFMPTALDSICMGKDLALQAQCLRLQQLQCLHTSHLRGSGSSRGSCDSNRGSRLSSYDATSAQYANLFETDINLAIKSSTVAVSDHEEGRVVRDAWEPLRWTGRVVLAACERERAAARGLIDALTCIGKGNEKQRHFPSPQQRAKEHMRTYQRVLQNLKECNQRLQSDLQKLQAEQTM